MTSSSFPLIDVLWQRHHVAIRVKKEKVGQGRRGSRLEIGSQRVERSFARFDIGHRKVLLFELKVQMEPQLRLIGDVDVKPDMPPSAGVMFGVYHDSEEPSQLNPSKAPKPISQVSESPRPLALFQFIYI